MTLDSAYIVIDTNVYISAAILPHSKMAHLLALAAKSFVFAQNDSTWEELITRLQRKKFDRYLGEKGCIAYLSTLAQLVEFFPAKAQIQISRDRSDDKFLGLAVDAHAKLIVSGDLDLQEIQTFQGIEILSPAHFLQRFAS
jgi:putative PIN family toxin of toxin-antitoxin system